jgi:hypothetical protein
MQVGIVPLIVHWEVAGGRRETYEKEDPSGQGDGAEDATERFMD